MSHITTLTIDIRDLDALATACESLGLQLKRDQKTYRTFAGTRNECVAAIVDPNNHKAYEIGVVQDGDGTTGRYRLSFDDWQGGGGMVSKVGQNCGTLLQGYGLEAAKAQARKQGWKWKETKQENGSVKLSFSPKPQF